MNHNVSNHHSLFVDRPLHTQNVRNVRPSTLRLLKMEEGDFAETAVRLFLLLCLAAALVLGGLRIQPTASQTGDGAGLCLPSRSPRRCPPCRTCSWARRSAKFYCRSLLPLNRPLRTQPP